MGTELGSRKEVKYCLLSPSAKKAKPTDGHAAKGEYMRNRLKVNKLRDFFSEKEKRPDEAVFFERICEYNKEIRSFLREYYAAAMASGIVIEEGLKNPVSNQLSYYTEVLGTDFRLDKGFIRQQLNSWLPRIDDRYRDDLSAAIAEALVSLRNAGKNDNALKNAYIKIMC